jgi:hypothetical protein
MLSDDFWLKLKQILLEEAIYNKRNLRMTVEGSCIECGLVVRVARLTWGIWKQELHLQRFNL